MAISKVIFFPVDNGSMVLIKLNDSNETSILIDINIKAENDEDELDLSSLLRDELKCDDSGIPYVDVFLLTHNDSDHITGFVDNFHTAPYDDYVHPEDGSEGKIVINEIWGSAKFWKRESSSNTLTQDAKAFNKEMKRRVALFEEEGIIQDIGNRVLIIGKDPDGKTDDLEEIVREIDSSFHIVNQIDLKKLLSIFILGPLPQQDNEEDEEYKISNRASVIMQFEITIDDYPNKILIPGDAEVFVWETLWNKWGKSALMEYDVLETPHHCSWHSLSHDSQSNCDSPKVSNDAKNALSQIVDGGFIISSSKAIENDENDPPSYEAKKEYLTIADKKHFLTTGEYPDKNDLEPIVINLTGSGPQEKSRKAKSKISSASSASTGQAFPHGR